MREARQAEKKREKKAKFVLYLNGMKEQQSFFFISIWIFMQDAICDATAVKQKK